MIKKIPGRNFDLEVKQDARQVAGPGGLVAKQHVMTGREKMSMLDWKQMKAASQARVGRKS